MGNVTDEQIARFWAKVDKTGDCWVWTAALSTGGYGKLSLNQRVAHAHRVAYTLCIGPIPDRLLVCHTCDNRRCVRPDHLFVGTHLDNARDRDAKGRLNDRAGELNGRARFTVEDIREIRQLADVDGLFQYEIAERFGTRQSRISDIVLRKTWREVV